LTDNNVLLAISDSHQARSLTAPVAAFVQWWINKDANLSVEDAVKRRDMNFGRIAHSSDR